MKCNVNKSFSGIYSGKKGQVIDLPEDEAKALEGHGIVTIIAEDPAPVEKPKAPKASKKTK